MVIVSLGSNCSVAYQLNLFGLRSEAFPFDWAKLSLNSLILTLENNFKDFQHLDVKKFSNNHYSIEHLTDTFIEYRGSFILKNCFSVEFAHEVFNKYNLREFEDKLKIRIERFINLDNPTFIRLETSSLTETSNRKYDHLVELLNRYFTDYKLIVISNITLTNSKIINVLLRDFDKDWRYSGVDWFNVFNSH